MGIFNGLLNVNGIGQMGCVKKILRNEVWTENDWRQIWTQLPTYKDHHITYLNICHMHHNARPWFCNF